MKKLVLLFAALLVAGCGEKSSSEGSESVSEKPTPSNESADALSFESLTGVVIRKPWTKSRESWEAGGSEYYVLKIEDFALPSEKRTAKGSVILRESKALPFERFTNFVGQSVICKGEFVTGKPYIPPADSAEQVPSPVPIFLGESEPPLRGGGFKVYAITRIEGK